MRPEDIPDDIWEAAEAAGEAMHGRHERGWVAWPLIPAHGTASNREIVARALLAERLKERAACEAVAREHQRARWGGPDNDPNVVLRKTALSIAQAISSRP